MTGQVKDIGGNAYVPPIGYVWKSANATCPAEMYDGTTWAQIKDQAILASGEAYTLGDSGGSAMVTLTTEELPSHTHSGNTSSDGAHTHTVKTERVVQKKPESINGNHVLTSNKSIETSSDGAHTHAVTVGQTGEGKAFDIMMPYIVRYMWERIG